MTHRFPSVNSGIFAITVRSNLALTIRFFLEMYWEFHNRSILIWTRHPVFEMRKSYYLGGDNPKEEISANTDAE